MSVTVTAKKTVGFRAPYIGKTFQELAQKIIGRDGYLSGGSVSDDGSFITIEPAVFISRGIVAESLEQATGLAVPTLVAPWFLLAATPDDDPDSGVIFQVTADLTAASVGVIIAYKPSANDGWHNPLPVHAQGAFQRASEPGAESTVVPGGINVAGNITSLVLPRGQVVDPDGVRRALPRLPASSTRTLDVSTVGGTFAEVGNEFVREDLVVLRQREAYTPEVVSLFNKFAWGGTRSTWNAGASASVPHIYSKRGGNQGVDQWVVYSDGANIRATAGTTAFQPFAGVLVAVAGSTVDEVLVVGQRVADDRVILLYVHSGAVEMLSFNQATGALVDSNVVIDTQGGLCRNVRAELDHLERLHIVYEHNEGAEQQVYYTRVSIAAASFGTHQVAPKIVNTGGLTSGRDEVTPDIGVTRAGKAHIVLGSHAGPPAIGDDQNETDGFVYAVMNQNGDLESRTLYPISSSCGRQQQINYREDGSEPGFVAHDYVRIHTPRITVTVHDEVMVAMKSGPATTEILLFAPDFEDRLGFAIVNLVGAETFDALSVDITSDEMGRPLVAFTSTFGATIYGGGWILLDTVYAPSGFIDEHSRWLSQDSGFAITNGDDATLGLVRKELDIRVERGCRGEFHICGYHNADAEGEVKAFAAYGDAWEGVPHPNDVYLGRVRVPGITDPSDPILADGNSSFGVFNTRQKKMNYPFLVGKEGDFQGYASIQKAVAVANRLSGQVVIRPGDYRENFDYQWGAMQLYSGVSILGEGKPIIPWPLRFGMSTASFAGVVSGDIWTADTSTRETLWLRAGDVVVINSRTHRILQVLNPVVGSVESRFLLSKATEDGGAPTTGVQSLIAYPAGNRIENLTIEASAGDTRLSVYKSHHGIVRDVDFSGYAASNTADTISVVGSLGLLLDHLDFALAENSEIGISGGTKGLVLRGCTTKAGELVAIGIANTEERPVLVDCSRISLNLTAGRTDPVQVVGLDNGVDTGFVDGTADTFTGVGKVVKTIDGTMHLQDANTRAGAAPNGSIPLADAAAGGDILPAGEVSILGAIFANDAAADQNATDIGTNATNIGTNATNIGNNATAIGNNDTDIGNNATAIGTNATNIGNEITDRTNADAALGTQIVDYNSNHDAAGVLRGLAPSQGAGTTLNFALGEGVADGKYFSVSAGSESTATAGNTTYYYYFDADGAIQRTTVAPFAGADPFNAKCYIAQARTDAGNTTFTYIIDYRRLVNAGALRTPVIVCNPDIGDTLGNFFSLHAAVEWIERVNLQSLRPRLEIIITQLLDYTNGEDSIDISIYSASTLPGHLTIRGEGGDAGIKWGQNSTIFTSSGGPGTPAITDPEMSSLRVSNLIFQPTFASPIAAYAITYNTGWVGRICIDNVKIIHNGANAFNGLLTCSKNADLITVSDCEADCTQRAVQLTGSVKKAYVLRNTFRGEGGAAEGIRIDDDIAHCWICDNTLEPGRVAGGRVFNTAIYVDNFDRTAGPGSRYILNNTIVHDEYDDNSTNYAIYVAGSGVAANLGAAVVIAGNTIFGNYDKGIYVASSSQALTTRIVDNHVEMSSTTLDYGGIDTERPNSIIANNYVKTFGTTNNPGILITANKCMVVGNHIEADTDGRAGIYVFGNAISETVIVGNYILGAYLQGGIWIRSDSGRAIGVNITGNMIHCSASGSCIKLQDTEEVTIAGNTLIGDDAGCISVDDGSRRFLITGNTLKANGTATSDLPIAISGDFGVLTGNMIAWPDCVGTTNGAVYVTSTSTDVVVTGNLIEAETSADYDAAGVGSKGMVTDGIRTCIVGNIIANRGESASRATLDVQGTLHCVLGNILLNPNVSATHLVNGTGATSEWGTGNTTATTGANKQA